MAVTASARDGIHVEGLVKRFGRVTALDGLDLEVGRGEIVSLLGPNGSGKSTLMRILGTIVLPDHGSVSVCGVDVVSDPVGASHKVGLMVGDHRSFYWRLSGRENIVFFGALHGLRRKEALAQSAGLLELVELTEVAERPVRGYSSGMRARLSLARALLADPPLLLLDEPTQNLDPVAAVRFRDTAVSLARGRGAGILLATHDLSEAVAISDRVVVLAAGRKVLEKPIGSLDADRLKAMFLEAVQKHVGDPDLDQ